MTRREVLRALGAKAAALAAVRERAAVAAGPNIKWAVSMFLWTSTQWPDRGPVPFTDILHGELKQHTTNAPLCSLTGCLVLGPSSDAHPLPTVFQPSATVRAKDLKAARSRVSIPILRNAASVPASSRPTRPKKPAGSKTVSNS